MSVCNQLITIAAALALAACASSVPNEALVQAEQAYGSAAQEPEVANNAPVLLYEAKKDLDLAQQTWLADEPTSSVSSRGSRQRRPTAGPSSHSATCSSTSTAPAFAAGRSRTCIGSSPS
jgi:hypothetical protein